jgi:hypothetical protein
VFLEAGVKFCWPVFWVVEDWYPFVLFGIVVCFVAVGWV